MDAAIERFDGGERYGDLKKAVIDIIQSVLSPIRDEYYRLENSDYVDRVLDKGRERACEIASKKYEMVRSIVGFGR